MTEYKTLDLVRMSGATKPQIDKWCNAGHLQPKVYAEGGTRHFSPVEADVAVLMARFIKHLGMQPTTAAKLARSVAVRGARTVGVGGGIVLTIDPPLRGYASQRGPGGT